MTMDDLEEVRTLLGNMSIDTEIKAMKDAHMLEKEFHFDADSRRELQQLMLSYCQSSIDRTITKCVESMEKTGHIDFRGMVIAEDMKTLVSGFLLGYQAHIKRMEKLQHG